MHRALGMSARGGSHRPLLSAYHRLRQEVFEPGSENSVKSGGVQPEVEEATNRAAVSGYNAALKEMGPAAPSSPPAGGDDSNDDDDGDDDGVVGGGGAGKGKNASGKSEKKWKKWKKKRRGGGGDRREEAEEEEAGATATTKAGHAALPWYASRVKHCRRAAEGGEMGVRLAWGSAQEAGTMATLMLHYSESVAEEVGLCLVDRDALPRKWNLGPLPPIGASPDGIIYLPKKRNPGSKSSADAADNGGGGGGGDSAAAAADFDDSYFLTAEEAADAAGSRGGDGDKAKGKKNDKEEDNEDADREYMAFVGGVPYTVMEPELVTLFSRWGLVRNVKLVKEKGKVHKHKGYGFVTFATKETASHVRAVGKVMFNGLLLDVGEPVRNAGKRPNTAGEWDCLGIIFDLDLDLDLKHEADLRSESGSGFLDSVDASRAGAGGGEAAAAAFDHSSSGSSKSAMTGTGSGDERAKPKAKARADEADKELSAYVGAVPSNMTETELACVFSKFGEVKSIRIIRKEQKKGYGFVKFATKQAVNDALTEGKVAHAGTLMYVREVTREGPAGEECEDDDDQGWERLVVEVKNSSPFRSSGSRRGQFQVCDRDPYDHPPAYHMPQLQMEMLAAGTRAGLLAMQSATRGVRVFRVERDDWYIRAMLTIVSEFYVTYVLPGVEPPERMFASRKIHKDLVAATVRLARNAVLWDHIPKHHMLPGEEYDLRPFITDRR